MKLYKYPDKAKVATVIPKNKFYEQGNANRKIEQLFIEQVEKIIWAYKLSADTIHLEAQDDLKEIQIFQIQSRVENIDLSILSFIDKLIPSPIIFEVEYEGKIQVVAAYKRLNQSDLSKTVLGGYYSSGWVDPNERVELPIYLKLADLYKHLITQLLPLRGSQTQESKDNNETIEERLEQAQRIEVLKKQIERLQSKLRNERQYNRKVEINKQIHSLESELKKLQG